MSGLTVDTHHGPIALDVNDHGSWRSRCPQCAWAGPWRVATRDAINDADRHSDDTIAAGLEDPPTVRMPDPMTRP